ncbi:MAG TPA: BACON domain-containing carbohydrate-binding protein [Blastocatellia bacterium]|nr:BACON domain-containing carbohydrate-binding protein [Blastocatellia bacterium]
MKRHYAFYLLLMSAVALLSAHPFGPRATRAFGAGPPAANFGNAMPAPPMIFTVNSSADPGTGACDSGECTLREAILAANLNPGADTIVFSISTGPQKINLLGPLPNISEVVTIDGTLQPGFSGAPLIELNGQSAGEGTNGLSLTGGDSTVRGLVINNFGGSGITISNLGGNTIEGNYIGTNLLGQIAQGNAENGVVISNSSNNIIGGTTDSSRNVISGNLTHGVLIIGSPATGNHVRGNFIGTNVAGTSRIANNADGVSIIDAPGNTVGGTQAGMRNVISGNDGKGVSIQFSNASGNAVQGNFIGTDVNGTDDLGNEIDGIDLFESSSNIIGGTAAGARNIISGNNANGIRINLGGGNQIRGNFIGTKIDGRIALPNLFRGIFIGNGSNNNVIGGPSAGEGNTIANNSTGGVLVQEGTGNAIRANLIFANGGLGIDLAPVGVTNNDPGDPDSGPNNLQNTPIITSASSASATSTNVQGTLNSTANTSFTIDFFSNIACDPLGSGEGQEFLGSTSVTTNGSGNASFNVTLPASASAGPFITATATNPTGNTSEFSPCVIFTSSADLAVTKQASSAAAVAGATITYTITVSNFGPDTPSSVVVTDSLPGSLSFVSCNAPAGIVCSGSGNDRVITFGPIAPNTSQTASIVARVSCSAANGSVINNTATVDSANDDPQPGNNSSVAATFVSNPPASFSPPSDAFSSAGGAGQVVVTRPAGCDWTATSNAAFITITGGGSGSGNGSVIYTVSQNAGPGSRTGTLTIAGQTFTVTQSGTGCAYSISPSSASIPASGGTGTVNVTAGAGCSWRASSRESWITFPVNVSGTGNGTLTFAVEANAGAARSGTFTVENQTFTINQAGGATTFAVSGRTATASGLGIPGVTITFTRVIGTGAIPPPVQTNASGNWSQTGFEAGTTYRATPSKRRFAFTPPSADFAGASTIINFRGARNVDTTGVFRPSNGALFLKNANDTGFADTLLTYGIPGDFPVTGDWDGDGVDTIGVYRGGNFLLRNSNTNGFADLVITFGAPGDQPVVGDWDGDGIDTIGIYRNGTFFLRNSNTTGAPDLVFELGIPGDVGISGDWDGDGIVTTGVFRPSNGALFLKNTNSTGFADIFLTYGLPGDKPVTGDWNGDGVDTIGVYRNGDFFLRNSNTNGFAEIVFTLGVPEDHPIVGDWNGLP